MLLKTLLRHTPPKAMREQQAVSEPLTSSHVGNGCSRGSAQYSAASTTSACADIIRAERLHHTVFNRRSKMIIPPTPQMAKDWPNSGQIRPKSGQCWPFPGKCWPMFVKIGENLLDVCLPLAHEIDNLLVPLPHPGGERLQHGIGDKH